jgi:hypothetical protein
MQLSLPFDFPSANGGTMRVVSFLVLEGSPSNEPTLRTHKGLAGRKKRRKKNERTKEGKTRKARRRVWMTRVAPVPVAEPQRTAASILQTNPQQR